MVTTHWDQWCHRTGESTNTIRNTWTSSMKHETPFVQEESDVIGQVNIFLLSNAAFSILFFSCLLVFLSFIKRPYKRLLITFTALYSMFIMYIILFLLFLVSLIIVCYLLIFQTINNVFLQYYLFCAPCTIMLTAHCF